jgi:hypothetical protein
LVVLLSASICRNDRSTASSASRGIITKHSQKFNERSVNGSESFKSWLKVGGSPIQGMMVFTTTEDHNINFCRLEQFRSHESQISRKPLTTVVRLYYAKD